MRKGRRSGQDDFTDAFVELGLEFVADRFNGWWRRRKSRASTSADSLRDHDPSIPDIDFREPHVAPINNLVDILRGRHPGKFIPYLSPSYGGTRARVFAVFQ
ncbi:hypothetical protein, partial [Kribbella ginsengisoli]